MPVPPRDGRDAMKALFVHQNFPGQFRPIAAHLAARPGNTVMGIGSRTARDMPGVSVARYDVTAVGIEAVHPFARRFDLECRRAEQIVYVAGDLIAGGFAPDVVFVHCGWGESLPIRSLFPRAKLVTYFEFFYREAGLDVGFDPESPALSVDGIVALRARNAATLLALAETDVALSPTAWQRSVFPPAFQPRISVCHEGIDLDAVRPDPNARLSLPDGTVLEAGDEVVTFVARNLEPLRGYHSFMRALPQVLRDRRSARVLIVGGDGVSYGAEAERGRSWKDVYLDENRRDLDLGRVHFLGSLPYADYLKVLQVSSAHVYLTYPFVLSWSMLEAMAAECLVIGSATAPVQEVIDRSNGVLVDFFDTARLARTIVDALAEPRRFAGLRKEARRTVERSYERSSCLARLMQLIA